MALPQSCLLELFVGFAKMCKNQNSSSELVATSRNMPPNTKKYSFTAARALNHIKVYVKVHTVM